MAEQLTVYTDRPLGRITPELYGHFIEHLGHCIYDGIWVGRGSAIPNVEGIRREAIDVLRDAGASVIRWPGGYFADLYDWRDGIGPAGSRPVRIHECEPGRREPNSFGTHEFLRLCELAGAQANICVNTAILTAQDAMNWVEYCNADGDTSFAALRRRHGREEPWAVRYWAIGNESYWLHRCADYVQRFLLWRRFMKRVDPSIQCIASLIEPTVRTAMDPMTDWLVEVVKGIRGEMELASLHLYSGGGLPGETFDEGQYWQSLVEIEQRNRLRIESMLGVIDAIVGDQRVRLALDEWGLWHAGATMTNNAEQPCTHRDAIFAAAYFHMLHDYADRIALATIAQSVNVLHSLLRTDGPRTYRTPTLHVFRMFRGHQGAQRLLTAHGSPVYEFEPRQALRAAEPRIDKVTVAASRAGTGEMLITMTNADLERSYDYRVEFVGASRPVRAAAEVLTADPHAQNSFEDPDAVRPKDLPVTLADGALALTLPPCSVIAIRLAE